MVFKFLREGAIRGRGGGYTGLNANAERMNVVAMSLSMAHWVAVGRN